LGFERLGAVVFDLGKALSLSLTDAGINGTNGRLAVYSIVRKEKIARLLKPLEARAAFASEVVKMPVSTSVISDMS
jgi:hypothetical protein